MKSVDKILKGFLIFGGAYFIFDGLLHLIGIKLISVINLWPESALSYAKLINQLYASFIILAGIMALFLQQDLKKYKDLITVSAAWATFHGIILLSLIFTARFGSTFQELDSLRVWLPFYEQYLLLNAVLLFTFSGLVFMWRKR